MGGIANGIAYHGGFIPYVATFLTFSDYMRGSVRLAALAGLHVDLRLDPRFGRARRGRPDPSAGRALRRAPGDPEPVVRPTRRCERGGRGVGTRRGATRRPGGPGADPPEAADARGHGRARARGRCAAAATSSAPASNEAGGGAPAIILIATGSELQLAFGAAEALEARGHRRRGSCRCPAGSAFDAAGRGVSRIGAPERRAATGHDRGRRSLGWERYAGDDGAIIGIDHFGASAPAADDLRALRLHDGARRRRRPPRGREGERLGRVPTLDPGHQPHGLGAAHGDEAMR